MLVEWEITLKCNFGCFYCTNLDQSLRTEMDKDVIREFIRTLGEKYPGVEIFVFGGEPFIHPHIEFIIQCFNEFKVPFVIQTNFSKKSVAVMRRIQEPFKINISIHPTEIKLEQLDGLFDNASVNINYIDVMYTGKEAIKYYLKIKELTHNHPNLFLTPISDFGDGISNGALEEFNALRYDSNYCKFIQFEQVKRMDRYRSEVWGDPNFNPRGKPCLYNNKYFLYGPNLELYNCCYRTKHNGICNHDKCFLM